MCQKCIRGFLMIVLEERFQDVLEVKVMSWGVTTPTCFEIVGSHCAHGHVAQHRVSVDTQCERDVEVNKYAGRGINSW